MRRQILFSLLLVGCAGNANDDVVGPYTGEIRRFVVDDITLPQTVTQAKELAADLNGDDAADNQLGQVISTLAQMGNVTSHAKDIIAAGQITSFVEIVANDFGNDETVSVKLVGAVGEDAIATGGRFVDGHYTSNRTASSKILGGATLHLPVFVDADPSVVPVVGLEILLEPDGSGGFYASVHGAVPHPHAIEMAYLATAQMISTYPSEHIGFLGLFDSYPRDWMVSHDEFTRNSLILALMAPDIRPSGKDALSLGVRMHLSPCADGTCLASTSSCFNRVQDGDETDIDCGGSCHGCVEGSMCNVAGDCETAGCTGGSCDAASCTNGVRDSFESDADCGRYCGTKCAPGKRCYYADDCASGMCGMPCDPDSYWCSNDYETCQ